MTTRTYWASEPVDRIGGEIRRKVDSYDSIIGGLGRADKWRRAARALYGLDPEGGTAQSLMVSMTGEHGEIVQARANFFAMYVRARSVLATGAKPTFQARPRAYDAQTTELVGLMNAIIDMVLDGGADQVLTETERSAEAYGEGWTGVYWDPNAGQETEQGKEGDVVVETYRPDQIIRDPACTSWRHNWIAVRRLHSRWDLAAQYPEHADAIISAPSPGTSTTQLSAIGSWATTQATSVFEDQVEAYEFWHKPTTFMPEGRASIVVNGVAIADGPNPYGELPVMWLVPKPEPDVAFGFAETWDLLALQALADSALTQAASMQENFGMTSVVAPPGAAIETEALSKGMRALYATQAIAPMSGQGNGVENAISFVNAMSSLMQQIMAMNETALGQGSSSASGASITAQMQIAAQNNSGIVRSYLGHFRDVLCAIVKRYQRFATVERSVRIVGKLNSGKVVRWKNESIAAIDGVDVELIGTAARTTQARYQFMQDMVTAGLITDVEVAQQVWATGRLEPVFDGPAAREANIERENEMLQQGQPVLVLPQDHHSDHIRRHSCLLFDPSVRDNPDYVQNVQTHIHEHALTWSSMMNDQSMMAILQATGQQPPPPPPMPMMPPGMAPPPVEGTGGPQAGPPLPNAESNPQGPTDTGLPPPAQTPVMA